MLFFFQFLFCPAEKEHEHDQKDMYDVHPSLHMRSVDHHMSSNSPASRLLSLHSAQSHPLQSSPPMHPPQKSHQLQQLNSVSECVYCGYYNLLDK